MNPTDAQPLPTTPDATQQGGDLGPSQIDPDTDPIDVASDASFPASDPPSTTMATTPERDAAAGDAS